MGTWDMYFKSQTFSKTTDQAGFTLIELMVVILILFISFTLTVVTLRGDRARRRLTSSVREFYSQLIYARNLATSGKVFKDELDADGIPNAVGDGLVDVPNGYGLRVYSSSGGGGTEFDRHFIFGDLYINPDLMEYDIVNMEERFTNNIAIEPRLRVDVGGITLPLDIFFETEWGTISFADASGPLSGATLTFVFTDRNDAALRQEVIINKDTSQIYVKSDF